MAKVVLCLGATLSTCLYPYGDVNVTEATQPITTTSTTTSTSIVMGSDVRRPDDSMDYDLLACIRSFEGQYDSNTGNGYYGAYQADQATWNGAVARAGYSEWVDKRASDAPPEVQDNFARQLYKERGLQPWPTPSRMCTQYE